MSLNETTPSPQRKVFHLNYAPHFGMFQNHAGSDPVDQLKFAADEGFRAWEDNGMKGRSPQEQEKIAKTMSDLGITMGVFVANTIDWTNPTLTTGRQDHLERFVKDIRDSVEVAKRVNAKWMTVVPGTVEPRLENGIQTANVIDALRRGAEVFEPHGLVMVLEPLNFRDHPNLFLNKIAQAFAICRAVNSPACKILDDLYHQQVHEGNLIPNLDQAWSEIAYFQIGDNPGRREPTTGEINFRNVFRHIHGKRFEGIMGMEHGNARPGKEGERALIDAYRSVDDF
ncbi:MAG: TIM barrel protein [Fimbriimonadaceae bacterium]|nr:MAG: Hydroxypyruvate isomerase [Armatimonadetes bacterium OLB18]MBV6491644.1 2-oxo-tetronate isomerase [Fimbriimonadaceae bacterium]QOJ13068.1 MAG: TIM barrel protein [Chthonomonadaceae bacterium]RIK01474.1 MAG: xylose isomerase [Armatimonadota bacterium]MCC6351122.1 TIM barrel protein [Fimbriimonadaceae bacterium]